MSNINKKSTLVYNGGSFKFKNTEGNNFRSFEILTNAGVKKIEQLLDLDSNSDNTVYSLEYKNDLNSYNIKNFFFFYQEILEDTKMDLSSLMVKDDSKIFLVFVDIAKDSRLVVEGTYKWNGEIPVFESGNKYLFLVQKKDDSSLVLTLIAKSVSRNNVLTLVFRIRKGEETLDLRSAFPEYIYCFKPRYNFKISWGDEDEPSSEGVFSNGIKNLIHTYNVELEDDRSSHVDFTVKIRGVCEGLGQVPHNCIRCEESSGIKYFGKCFSYCPEFYEFPETFFHSIGEQSELHGCFQGTSISQIPENIFPENNHIKRIISLFSECVKLDDTKSDISIIPENLFKPLKGLEELISVFDSSYYISKVPKNILKNNPKLKNVERCFALMGLDQGENKSSATIKDWIIDNIPEGIVDGKNIKNTEATFSGLGLGRVIRHVDDKNNPHETTLQKAYDVQQLSNGNVELNVNRGFNIKKSVRDSNFSDYELFHGVGRFSDMVQSGIKNNKGDFIGFATDIIGGIVSNSVSGSPLTLFSPAIENNQAVTLKQLKDAKLNGLELIGSWNINENTTDYSTLGNGIVIDTSSPPENENLNSEDQKFKIGACYYVRVADNKSARIQIDGVWWSTGDYLLIIGPKGNGWTSSGSNPNISKIENNPSIKSVFENPNVNESLAYIGEVTKTVVKGNPYSVLLQIPSNINEDSVLKNVNNKGFEIKPDGSIVISGILKQEESPLNDIDVTNKRYVDNEVNVNLIGIKSLDNINEDSTKIDSAWFGMNMFKNQTFFEDYMTISGQADFSNKVDFGSSDVGWFRFNFVNEDENLKRFEFVNSSKETSYRLDCKNSSVEQVFEMTDDESEHKESLKLDLNNNLFEKTYINIPVKTNKSEWNSFMDDEFVSKSAVNSELGKLDGALQEHIKSLSHVSVRESEEEYELKKNLPPTASKTGNYKAFTFHVEDLPDNDTSSVNGKSFTRWSITSIFVKGPTKEESESEGYTAKQFANGGVNLYMHVFVFNGDTWDYEYRATSKEALKWNYEDTENGLDGWQEWEFEKNSIIVDAASKVWITFTTSKTHGAYNGGYAYRTNLYEHGLAENTLALLGENQWVQEYESTLPFKVKASPLASLTAQNHVLVTSEDLEGKIYAAIRQILFPVGFIYSSINVDPPKWPGDTQWIEIGTSTIGSTTLHHWRRHT